MRRAAPSLAIAGICLAVLAAAPVAGFQSLEEIIARNLEARGGVEKLRSLQTVKITGAVTARGEPLPMTTWAKRPNLIRRDTKFPDRTTSVAFDGATVWGLDSTMGDRPQQVTGPEAEATRADAAFDPLYLDYRIKGHRIELVGTETLDGRQVHHLKVTKKTGQEEHHYLDAETGLEARTVTVLERGGRKAEIRTDLSDYRNIDGMQVAFLMRQFLDGKQVLQVQLEKVEFDAPIEDAVFRLTK